MACGEGLHQFSPRNLNLALGEYHWKVWSPSVKNYHEYQPKLEGSFTAGECGLPYRSDEYWVQWGCRNQDLLYCIDISHQGQPVAQPAVCGENLHQFSPRWLDRFGPGTYSWRVWSPSMTNGPQPGFEGEFTIELPKPITPDANISWEVLRGHQLLATHIDNDGILWLGTTGGLEKWQLEPAKKLLAEWHWTSGGFPANQIYGIAPGANNSLWLATVQGLLNFRDGHVQTHFTPGNSPLTTQYIRAIAEDGIGGIWAVGAQNLLHASFMHFDGFGRWQTVADIPQAILDKHALANITALASDKQGGLWVGLRTPFCYRHCPSNAIGGILHYDGQGHWYVLNEKNDKTPGNINALAIDQQGTLWTDSYYNQQLAYFDGQQWEEVSSVPQIDFLAIKSLATTETGIWVGFNGPNYAPNFGTVASRKVSHYDKNQWHIFSLDEVFPLPYISSQVAGLGDQIWVGGGANSLSYFDGNTWQNITNPSFSFTATDIDIETNTGNVWAAWNNQSLVRQTNQGTWEELPYVIPSAYRNDSLSFVTEILPTTGYGLWVEEASNKIIRINSHGGWQEVPMPEGRPSYEFKFANDKFGGLWMAGAQKLSYFHFDQLSQEYALPNNLPDEMITYLYHDGKKVWMGMQYTLASFENGKCLIRQKH